MKKLLFLPVLICTITTNAQVYLISFAGTGASATVGSVKVENMTAGTSLTLSGGNVLRLGILTGIDHVKNTQLSGLKIYPNPTTGNSVVQIYPPAKGNADIKVFDMTGREVAQMRSYLENSLQEFRLSGFQKGFYMISVTGNSYSLSGKLISNAQPSGKISIEKITNNLAADEKASKNMIAKGVQDYIDMPYSVGDRIKFTGISGNYSTVKTDIPTGDKTITFKFISCTDGDNINYPAVEIGNQVWMAENLKTTKYRNGDLIGTTVLNINAESFPKYQWPNGNNDNNVAVYGRIYTWFAVTDSRNICPTGWHAATDTEWTTLVNFLGGESVAGGKLKEIGTVHWTSPNTAATNETGFTALPGGYRLGAGAFTPDARLGEWWSSTEYNRDLASYNYIRYDNPAIYHFGDNAKSMGLGVRCLMGEGVVSLSVTTTAASSTTQTTSKSGGYITGYGGTVVTDRGVCWNTSANPTIANNHTSDGVGAGLFTSNLTGLTMNRKYYLRAYATNSEGTTYGNEVFFITRGETGVVADIDGNIYSTIAIGTQIWMAENLKTTRYNDNTTIPLVTDNTLWSTLTTPAYCFYNNDALTYKDTYGCLYNWYTVKTGKLCPVGWHVPSKADWTTLTNYLTENGYGYEGVGNEVAKSLATTSGWQIYNESLDLGEVGRNQEGNNSSGFNALPGGRRGFSGVGLYGSWWTSSEYLGFGPTWAIEASIHYNNGTVMLIQNPASVGSSMRCLKED